MLSLSNSDLSEAEMPAHKNLLIRTEWVIAGRVRKCYHDKKHQIVKGDNVLEAADGMGMNGYCEACGRKMIAQAKERLDGLIPSKTP
jgi:hypothetical protein